MSKVSFSDEKITLINTSNDRKGITQEEYMNLYVNGETNETKKGNRTITRKSVKN